MSHDLANPLWMSIAWTLANVVTGIAYFAIPLEVASWVRPIMHSGLRALAALFVSFIVFCGLHHIVMAFYVHSHPITAILVTVDCAMAVVSVMVAWVLAKNRKGIRKALIRAVG